MNIRQIISIIMHPNGKVHFLTQLHANASILDVGCGNNSPFLVKSILPHAIYTGIDIGDYNQTKPNLADNYVITTPDEFASRIADFDACFDAVVSSHNLEHCNDRYATFRSMLSATRPGGFIYVSFPSESSVRFPHRIGTLNYFDDPTHKDEPPKIDDLVKIATGHGFEKVFVTRRNQPWVAWLVGLILEPISILMKRVMRGTWELHGFEAIMILKRVQNKSQFHTLASNQAVDSFDKN